MLTANAQGVQKGVDAAIGSVRGLFSGIGSFAKMALAFTAGNLLSRGIGAAIGGAKDLAQWATETANEYERAEIAFQVMTGSRAAGTKLLGDLQQLAVETPFKSSEVVEQAKLLKAAGVETEDLIKTIRNLGDVAAGTGVDIGRLSLAYGQVISKGRFQASELRQFTEAGAGVRMFAQAAKMTNSQFLAAMEAGRISSDIVVTAFEKATEKGGMFFRLMDRQAQTVKGRFDSMIDSFEIFIGKVGLAAFRAFGLREFFDGMAKSIQNLRTEEIGSWFARAADGMQPFYLGLVGIKEIGKEFLTTLYGQAATWKDINKFGTQFVSTMLPLVAGLGKAMTELGIAVLKVMKIFALPDPGKANAAIKTYTDAINEQKDLIRQIDADLANPANKGKDNSDLYAEKREAQKLLDRAAEGLRLAQGFKEQMKETAEFRRKVTGGISDLIPSKEEIDRRTDSLADLTNAFDRGLDKAIAKMNEFRDAANAPWTDAQVGKAVDDLFTILDEEDAGRARVQGEKFAKQFAQGFNAINPAFKGILDDLGKEAASFGTEMTYDLLKNTMQAINIAEIKQRFGQEGGLSAAAADRLRVASFNKFVGSAGNTQVAPLVESRGQEAASLLNAARFNSTSVEDKLAAALRAQEATEKNTRETAAEIKRLNQFKADPVATFLGVKFGGG